MWKSNLSKEAEFCKRFGDSASDALQEYFGMGGGVRALVKIINDREYNTETAEEIVMREDDLGDAFVEETLYRKEEEFFLHIKGDSEKIIPLTIEEACVWVEGCYSEEVFEEIFGSVEE